MRPGTQSTATDLRQPGLFSAIGGGCLANPAAPASAMMTMMHRGKLPWTGKVRRTMTMTPGPTCTLVVPPPPLYKPRPCPSYSRRRDRHNLVRNLIIYEM